MPASLLASLLTFVVMAVLYVSKTWSDNFDSYGVFVTITIYLSVFFNVGFYYLNEAALEQSHEELERLKPVKAIEYSLRVISQILIINLWVIPTIFGSLVSIYFTLCALYTIILLWDFVVRKQMSLGNLLKLDLAGFGLSLATGAFLLFDHFGKIDLIGNLDMYFLFSASTLGYVLVLIFSIKHLTKDGKTLPGLLKPL